MAIAGKISANARFVVDGLTGAALTCARVRVVESRVGQSRLRQGTAWPAGVVKSMGGSVLSEQLQVHIAADLRLAIEIQSHTVSDHRESQSMVMLTLKNRDIRCAPLLHVMNRSAARRWAVEICATCALRARSAHYSTPTSPH